MLSLFLAACGGGGSKSLPPGGVYLAVSASGPKALSFLGSGGSFADGIEVLDATNSLVHTFEQLQLMAGVRFSADERFLVVIGNASGVGGDLPVIKIP